MNRTFITLSTAILLSLSALTVQAWEYTPPPVIIDNTNIANQADFQRQQELQNSIRYQQQQSTLNNINRNLEYQNMNNSSNRYNNGYSNRSYGYSNHF